MTPTPSDTPRTDKAWSTNYCDARDESMRLERENTALAAINREALACLQSIVDGAVHPDTAIRRVMVDLAPIRALLTRGSSAT